MFTIKYRQTSLELVYSLDIILKEHLGLDYRLEEHSQSHIEIKNSTKDGKLTLDTSFFKAYEAHYLKTESLPKSPLSQWTPERNGIHIDLLDRQIPVIYGKPSLEKFRNRHHHLHLDIFGSAFFMLSRYEELIISTRDNHDRFPATASLAYKENFLNRPIIDEYTEILWTCMLQLWPDLKRKSKKPKTFITCDVDQPFDCTVDNFKQTIRTFCADLIKRKSPLTAIKRINRYFFNKIGNYIFDPNYTFDWYMDICEKNGHQVTFFFIPDSTEPNNACYKISDNKIIKLINDIVKRGHNIGVHGSYNTYDNPEKLQAQKNLLQQILNKEKIPTIIAGNRQHYLRWDSAQTPAHLEKAKFTYDTTGSYPDHVGFKYGTSQEFSMWNWLSKSKNKIKQRPLIIMECTIFSESYMNLSYSLETIQYMKKLRENATKYGGNFTLLWHNSSLTTKQDCSFFEEMLK